MITSIIERYAEVKNHITKLVAEEAVLKAAILKDMEESGEKSVPTQFGKFTRSSRASWTYSAQVKKMAENLGIAQYQEQEKGTAKKKLTHYLTYTAPKND